MLTFLSRFVFLIAQKRPLKRGLSPKLKFRKTLQPQQIMLLNLKLHIVVFQIGKT